MWLSASSTPSVIDSLPVSIPHTAVGQATPYETHYRHLPNSRQCTGVTHRLQTTTCHLLHRPFHYSSQRDTSVTSIVWGNLFGPVQCDWSFPQVFHASNIQLGGWQLPAETIDRSGLTLHKREVMASATSIMSVDSDPSLKVTRYLHRMLI